MPKYIIAINRDACLGCGSCHAICPETFSFDKEANKAVVKKETFDKITCEREAANACPASAIDIREE